MKKKRLIIIILTLSLSLFITGCSNQPIVLVSYIIEGTVTLDEGNVEDVILRVEDPQGLSTVNPDSNGNWSTVVTEGNVTVDPFYDRDFDGQNDYYFIPNSWSKYVYRDRSGIDFDGTYGTNSYSMVQEMLGEWEFSYEIGSTLYIEYYIFNEIRQDSETGQYYAYGYKEGEYSSSLGYDPYGNEHTSVSTYHEEGGVFTVLWLSPDIARYGSYFEFNFITENNVDGYFYLISDGELSTADPMTGTRNVAYSSSLSTEKSSTDTSNNELLDELNQKHDESKTVSTQSSSDDIDNKLEIKEKAFQNKSK